MSLILIDEKAKFVHIPKTGGVSIRMALVSSVRKTRKAGVRRNVYPVNHTPQCWEICPYEIEFTFCFIRNPFKWYESAFCAVRGRWGSKRNFCYHPLKQPYECRSNTFAGYMTKLIEKYPGYCSQMFRDFIGTQQHPLVDFVGLAENSDDDFKFVCDRIGITAQRLSRLNRSPEIECDWTPALIDAVRKHDAEILERFYCEDTC